MSAFERFLTNFPDWRGKVTYLQITPRSRTGIPEYADMGRSVGEAVGRINGTFGEASWPRRLRAIPPRAGSSSARGGRG